MNWLAASTKFLVDDDVVVVATENDAVASLIADVSLVQQLGRLFALRNNNSLFVDSDGQVPRERTVDVPTTHWKSFGVQLSTRRRHPQGFVRQGRAVRWRRHAPRDRSAPGEGMQRELGQGFFFQ